MNNYLVQENMNMIVILDVTYNNLINTYNILINIYLFRITSKKDKFSISKFARSKLVQKYILKKKKSN